MESSTSPHLTATIDACLLPQSDELLYQGLLVRVQQVVVEHTGCARVGHEVHQALVMPLLWEAPVALRGTLQSCKQRGQANKVPLRLLETT